MSLTDVCDQEVTGVPNWHVNILSISTGQLPFLGRLLCEVPLQVRLIIFTITVNCVSHNPGATIQEGRIEEEVMSDRDGNSFVWFLAGLGIGAVVGVLYAPRSGEETREVLVSKAQEGRERVRQQARKAREQAGDWVDRGRDVVGQQKEQFRAAYEAGRQAYRETTATGTEPPSGV
jgi:gas vesicle protein